MEKKSIASKELIKPQSNATLTETVADFINKYPESEHIRDFLIKLGGNDKISQKEAFIEELFSHLSQENQLAVLNTIHKHPELLPVQERILSVLSENPKLKKATVLYRRIAHLTSSVEAINNRPGINQILRETKHLINLTPPDSILRTQVMLLTLKSSASIIKYYPTGAILKYFTKLMPFLLNKVDAFDDSEIKKVMDRLTSELWTDKIAQYDLFLASKLANSIRSTSIRKKFGLNLKENALQYLREKIDSQRIYTGTKDYHNLLTEGDPDKLISYFKVEDTFSQVAGWHKAAQIKLLSKHKKTRELDYPQPTSPEPLLRHAREHHRSRSYQIRPGYTKTYAEPIALT